MKFETILDATIAASIATTPYWYGNLDDKKAQKHNHRKGRQCAAFRARLVKMYNSMVKDKQMFEDLWKDYDD